MNLKTILFISLLFISELILAQDSCKVYQYTLESDTTIGLTIHYDDNGNVHNESFIQYKKGPKTTINDKTVKYYYKEIEHYSVSIDSNKNITAIEFYTPNKRLLEKEVILYDSDSIVKRYYYNDQLLLSRMTKIAYNERYKKNLKFNPRWGLEETKYYYSDKSLTKEETVVYIKDGSETKKVNSKRYSYGDSICTIREIRHSYPLLNPYRNRKTLMKYNSADYDLIVNLKETNRKNDLTKEVNFIYDDQNRLKEKIVTDGIINEKLWCVYKYY